VATLPRVFRLGGVPDSIESRLVSASLWMDGDDFFDGPTAGFIFGLEGIPEPRELTISTYSGRRQAVGLKISRLMTTDRPTRRWLRGFRVSSVERLLAECCASLPPRRVGLAMDDALRKRSTTIARLKAFAETWGRGRRGAKVFRDLVAARDPDDERIRSHFEKKMLAIVRRVREHHFIPDFQVNTRGSTYFIDFYLPAAQLGLECHSRRWHLGRHAEDARRDRDIRAQGIELIYFTWEEVCFDPDAVERDIRAAIARRIPVLPVGPAAAGR
jgi:very-short-patch-repair endonuclease